MHRPRALVLALVAGVAAPQVACVPSSNNTRQPTVGGDSSPESRETAEPGQVGSTEPEPEPAPAPIAVPAPHAVATMAVPRPTGPYRVRLIDASHRDLPTFFHGGRAYVLGSLGERYSIVVSNPTPRRVEAVVSVDGLDAIDGKPANFVSKRGYVLPAYGDTTIDGFRTSMQEVATFRFSSVADSYAGRLGEARDVGVIGVAFFPERAPVEVATLPPPADEPAGPSHPSYSPPRKSAAAPPAPPPAPAPAATAAGPATRSADLGRASGYGGATAEPRVEDRRGLGTEFGEQRESHIGLTTFERASATAPAQVVSFRYNDRAGLVALGIPVPGAYADDDTRVRETASPFRQNGFAQPPPARP